MENTDMAELRDRSDEQVEGSLVQERVQELGGRQESGSRRRFLTVDEVAALSRRCRDAGVAAVVRATGCSMPTIMRAKAEVGRSFSAQVIRQIRAYLSKGPAPAVRVGVPEEQRKRPYSPRARGPLVKMTAAQIATLRRRLKQFGAPNCAASAGGAVKATGIVNIARRGSRVRQEIAANLLPWLDDPKVKIAPKVHWRHAASAGPMVEHPTHREPRVRQRGFAKRRHGRVSSDTLRAIKDACAERGGMTRVAREVGVGITVVSHLLRRNGVARGSTIEKFALWAADRGRRKRPATPAKSAPSALPPKVARAQKAASRVIEMLGGTQAVVRQFSEMEPHFRNSVLNTLNGLFG